MVNIREQGRILITLVVVVVLWVSAVNWWTDLVSFQLSKNVYVQMAHGILCNWDATEPELTLKMIYYK